MCLSTVYALGKEQAPLARNVASVRLEDGRLILTDILGVRTELEASIERIDLLENTILVRPNP